MSGIVKHVGGEGIRFPIGDRLGMGVIFKCTRCGLEEVKSLLAGGVTSWYHKSADVGQVILVSRVEVLCPKCSSSVERLAE